nr:hypothetical protein [Corallococcus sp. AB045]
MHQLEEVRCTCLAAFRVDIARAGQSDEATALIDELMEASPDFRRLWDEGDLQSHGTLRKQLVRPAVGELVLESSVFTVEGGDGLSMFGWSPANEERARSLAQLVQRSG